MAQQRGRTPDVSFTQIFKRALLIVMAGAALMPPAPLFAEGVRQAGARICEAAAMRASCWVRIDSTVFIVARTCSGIGSEPGIE